MDNINQQVEKLQMMKQQVQMSGSDWLEGNQALTDTLYRELDEAIMQHQVRSQQFTLSVNNGKENNYLETFNTDDEMDIDECFFIAEQQEAMEITKRQVVEILRLELLISPELLDYDTWTVYSEGKEIYQLKRR